MNREDYFTGAKIFATIAGFLMVATAMCMSIASAGVIANNQIAIENAKAELVYNVSLQNYSNLGVHVGMNNELGEKWMRDGMIFFILSILCGIISISLWFAGVKSSAGSNGTSLPRQSENPISVESSSSSRRIGLEDFLDNHKNLLLTLAIFLLLTFTIVANQELPFWQVIGLLSALISYILMVPIISSIKDNESWGVSIFKMIFFFFIICFCFWVIGNVIIFLEGDFSTLTWGLWFLIFMIIASFRFFMD